MLYGRRTSNFSNKTIITKTEEKKSRPNIYTNTLPIKQSGSFDQVPPFWHVTVSLPDILKPSAHVYCALPPISVLVSTDHAPLETDGGLPQSA